MRQPRLSLEFALRSRYGEDDPQELKVSVTGDSFSGDLVIYDDHRKLAELCSAIDGYPKQPSDEVRFSLGMDHRLDIHLSCSDRSGHILLTATLVGTFFGPPMGTETLSAVLRCDPSSIDAFCATIQRAQPGSLEEATVLGRRQGQ
jgi:hypothetical protein